MSRYPHLFSPIIVRGQIFRNRIISAPQGGGPNLLSPNPNGYDEFTPAAAHYYGSIARGGAGAVCTGECGVDPRYSTSTSHFNFFTDSTLTGMHMVSDSIHAFGAKAAIELSHPGQFAPPGKYDPVGPTARTLVNTSHVEEMVRRDGVREETHVQALDKAGMDQIAQYFASAARMAQRGGFDMIVLHAGHGWLLSQFLSPHTNHRTDEYGQSPQNRVRFPIQVLKAIRAAVGDSMVIELRYSANEFVSDGSTLEEIIQMAQLLQPYVDILQCSEGIRSGLHSLVITHPTFFLKEACNSYLARELKRHLTIPVDAIGGIGDPDAAEQLLREGACDFVSLVRSQIADPDWSNKAKEGRKEDIRPCIRCLRCLSKRPRGESRCSVNPTHGWAFLEQQLVRPAAHSKKVLVVGGGPAGMQAALQAAARGHRVVLYEQSGRLGGQLCHASQISFKEHLNRYLRYLVCQVEKQPDITVHLGQRACPETVKAEQADAVIVAVGAVPVWPPIPGLERSLVLPAVDALEQPEKVGQRVVILGGGSVGCEAAVHFAGLGRQVTIVEAADLLMGHDADPHLRYHTMLFLDHEYDRETAQLDKARPCPNKVTVLLSTRCVEITGDHLLLQNQAGETSTLPADTVILAAGMKANLTERDRFWGCADTVVPAGDCLGAANLAQASRSGYFAALEL